MASRISLTRLARFFSTTNVTVIHDVCPTPVSVLEEPTPERLMPLTGSFQKRLELRR
jgi:hypothetical protein